MYGIRRIGNTGAIDISSLTAAPIDNYMWEDNGYKPSVTACLGCDDEALYVFFSVKETMPRAVYTKAGDPVYKDSCVELFLQPCPGEDARYLNFEMNSKGTLLLGLGEDRHERQSSDAPDLGICSIVTTDEWKVSYAIPFEWLESLFPGFTHTPGSVVRLNLYKCGDDTDRPHYGSWHPVTSDSPDFHRPQDFGEARFE